MEAPLKAILAIPLILLASSVSADILRKADGRPDLSGTYGIATLTPLERPEAYGDNLLLAPEGAEKLVSETQAFIAEDAKVGDIMRGARLLEADAAAGGGQSSD